MQPAGSGLQPRSGRCPPWTRLPDAIRLFVLGGTVRAALPVAAVVGCVLSAINEAPRLVDGGYRRLIWVQIAVNFVVPFLVASYGYLTAGRVSAAAPAVDAGK